MIKYILREGYRGVKQKYTLIYVIGMLVLCILANIAMSCFRTIYGMNDGAFAANLIIFAEGVFIIPYYTSIFISDIIFGRVYPNPYIKDGITRKLKRWQLYIGKYIASMGLGVLFYIVTFVFLIATTTLFSLSDHSIDIYTIQDFLEKSFVALPLWAAGISIGQMCLYLFADKRNSISIFYIVVLLIPRVILQLASESVNIGIFKLIREYLLTPQFQALQYFFTMDVKKCYILGAVYILISCAIGITAFYKKHDFEN